MKHQHSLELANALAQKCSEYLSQQKLPATPINYAIAYEIACGKNKALKQAVDELSQTKGLDNYVAQDLFTVYLEENYDEQQRFLDQVTELLQGLTTTCKNSADSTVKHQKSLEVNQQSLNKQNDPQKIIQALLNTTNLILGDQKKLYQRLKSAENEVQSLKTDLHKLEIESTTDSLSQLINRQGLKKIIKQRPLENANNCVVLLDIDHFKQVNDNFGHLFGDNVIKQVAREMKNLIRGVDIAVRWGGEEFLLVLRDTDLKGATLVANKIRKSIKNLRWRNNKTGEQLPPVSVSGGATQLRQSERLLDDLDAIIHRADEALYKAKQRGRDRICF